MKELAYINGVFCPIDEAKVSIEDRGFQFGDGVYEVVAAYGGQPFQLERHLQRLRKSLAAVRINYDVDARPLAPIIAEGLARCGNGRDMMVYIQITRGAAPRSHAIPDSISPTVVLTFKELPEVPADLRRRGIRLMSTPEIRWAHCFVKAITLLPNILVKSEALATGFDDAVFVTKGGEVRECTSANIFMVRGGEILMPPRTESILHGVTQSFLMDCAEGIGITMREQAFSIDELRDADEAFISSTTVEVLGVSSIDDGPIGGGKVGDVTEALFDEFRQRSRQVWPQSKAC